MKVRKAVHLALLVSLVLCGARAAKSDEQPVAQLGNALSCINSQFVSIQRTAPHYNAHSYLVRYGYGSSIEEKHEKVNWVQIIAYGPNEESANFYRVYFVNRDKKTMLLTSLPATLVKHDGKMEPDEVPGGVGSYFVVRDFIKSVSNQAPTIISDELVKPGSMPCIDLNL